MKYFVIAIIISSVIVLARAECHLFTDEENELSEYDIEITKCVCDSDKKESLLVDFESAWQECYFNHQTNDENGNFVCGRFLACIQGTALMMKGKNINNKENPWKELSEGGMHTNENDILYYGEPDEEEELEEDKYAYFRQFGEYRVETTMIQRIKMMEEIFNAAMEECEKQQISLFNKYLNDIQEQLCVINHNILQMSELSKFVERMSKTILHFPLPSPSFSFEYNMKGCHEKEE